MEKIDLTLSNPDPDDWLSQRSLTPTTYGTIERNRRNIDISFSSQSSNLLSERTFTPTYYNGNYSIPSIPSTSYDLYYESTSELSTMPPSSLAPSESTSSVAYDRNIRQTSPIESARKAEKRPAIQYSPSSILRLLQSPKRHKTDTTIHTQPFQQRTSYLSPQTSNKTNIKLSSTISRHQQQPALETQTTEKSSFRCDKSINISDNTHSPLPLSPSQQRKRRTPARSVTAPHSSRPVNSFQHQHSTLMAITEGCGVATEIGICTIHMSSSECMIAQISDLPTFTKTMHKIYLANPSKILVPVSVMDQRSKLLELIEKHFPTIQLTSLPRKDFNDEDGIAFIKKYGMEVNVPSLTHALSTKYYCLAAVAALFKYLENRDGWTFSEHTLKFIYGTVKGVMMIDAITAKNLELVNNMNKSHSKETLFGAMNHTTTPMGARLLRTTILQPCTDLETIYARHEAIQQLLTDEANFFSLTSNLKRLTDLDHIISAIIKTLRPNTSQQQDNIVHLAECKLNHIITLKNALNTIEQLSHALAPYVNNPLLHKIKQVVSHEKLNVFRQLIQETINEDIGIEKTSLGIRNQRCYAIKSGVNGLLDVARQTYKEAIESIYDTATEYCESTKLSLKLQFDTERKFHLCLPLNALTDTLPSFFINIAKKKKTITFTSLELLQKNSRVEESLSEILLMSDRSVSDLLKKFQTNIDILYKVSESIALLDLLLSFASGCMISEKVRPEFTRTLAIKSGRHPILDTIDTNDTIPNDTFASLSSTFQLVTGPNMSGKSTYIKQVALLTIMAHTGSFVPAEYASFKLVTQILSRLANDTDKTTSCFMAEMQEMAYILQHVTDSSLVIIDELGRGASRPDAIGIATAISEQLIQSKSQCFFATHLLEMASNLEVYPNVVNLQMLTETGLSTTMSFSHIVKDGLSTFPHYGIHVAKYMGLSQQIIDYATEVSDILQSRNNKSTMVKEESNISGCEINNHRYKVLYWFADKILQLSQSSRIDTDINVQLQHIQSRLKELLK
ncbi:muts domain V-domain-containing protein [Halteromyces radiatus]|uniref:muts domain V-domain-containing protein n=1 Tax=Halteromyces radiatus TaxID=101107 RepID=UPI002220EBF2|nr:muts domain V-domain-containing protein [Halteromyces radiatus]KAI8078626.1 muts domain V-domain-containing protein [Halteromyces radiatus]